MRLYLIRHGQSVNNMLMNISRERFDAERVHDPELTDTGKQQAQLVAQWLASNHDTPGEEDATFGFTHIYASPMIRAMDTARPIAEALDMPVEVWVDIHEIGGIFTADADDNITSFPGLTRREIETSYPNYVIPDAITEEGWWDTTIGRERPDQFVARAVRVAMALHDRSQSEDRVALVAHGAFIDALIKALLNQLPNHPSHLFYAHYNTGVTRVDFHESFAGFSDHIRVHYMNRVAHLPSHLRTW